MKFILNLLLITVISLNSASIKLLLDEYILARVFTPLWREFHANYLAHNHQYAWLLKKFRSQLGYVSHKEFNVHEDDAGQSSCSSEIKSFQLEIRKNVRIHNKDRLDLAHSALIYRLRKNTRRPQNATANRSSDGSSTVNQDADGAELDDVSSSTHHATVSLRREAVQSLRAAQHHARSGNFRLANRLYEHAKRLDAENPEIWLSHGTMIEEEHRRVVQRRGHHPSSSTTTQHQPIPPHLHHQKKQRQQQQQQPISSLAISDSSALFNGGTEIQKHNRRKTSDSDNESESESTKYALIAEHYFSQALIRNPELNRAEEGRRRNLPIVEKADQQRFVRIHSKMRKFFKLTPGSAALRRLRKELYFQLVFHTNAIEGNTLSLAQTRAILETRLAIGGKSLLEQNEVLGMDLALKYLNATLHHHHHHAHKHAHSHHHSLQDDDRRVSEADVLELHRRVLGFVDMEEAGRYRRGQVVIADHRPPPAHAVPGLMRELYAWLNDAETLADLHAIERAALAHWKLVFIHPFADGNGRTARLLMNMVLIKAGYPPAIIRLQDRPAYFTLIQLANQGDVRPFIRFIAECAERTLDEYLRCAPPSSASSSTSAAAAHQNVAATSSSSASSAAATSSEIDSPSDVAANEETTDKLDNPNTSNLPPVIYLDGR